MMKKNTTLKKLKTAASLADKAKKIEAKNGGKAVKVKGGLIKGKEHVSAKTSDGKVVSVRMFDENNTWLDTGKTRFY
ncbi:hypothetical protein N8I77_009575 [Diaporthe amygdali]|uniref:Uncharacterized protein n=1 Tax=Phomopsis amygdali TaxID=1214568 RepID=A0AAD9SAF9_PHOAM|nr:hypothetical protein N8I77_009575 [Diaporthe amygdali]